MGSSSTQIEGRIVPILPLGNRVLVRPKTMPDYVKSKDGRATIVLPDSCKPKAPTTGIVKCLGDGLFSYADDGRVVHNTKLRVGQEVLFSMYSGIEVKFREGDEEGNMYMILNEEDILGVMQENMELVPDEVPQGSWKAPQ